MVDKFSIFHLSLYGSLQLWVTSFIKNNSREQVINQRQEEWLILENINVQNKKATKNKNYIKKISCHGLLILFSVATAHLINKFRQVHVSHDSHYYCRFSLVRVWSLHWAQSTQDWKDIPQTKVIMHLQLEITVIVQLQLEITVISAPAIRNNSH